MPYNEGLEMGYRDARASEQIANQWVVPNRSSWARGWYKFG